MKEFNPLTFDYEGFIGENFKIVDKKGNTVPFEFNTVQRRFEKESNGICDIDILKARQQGFSSLITAIFATDFMLRKNSNSVVVADVDENAEGLLGKVKLYIQSYEEKNKIKVPLKYNSTNRLYNPFMNTSYTIGTAKNTEFGRSKTITNLHLSEVAFYPNIKSIIAGAGQAVVENGRKILETTANGFNDYKKFREESRQGANGYRALFYKASDFYSPEFLAKKKAELKELFTQEYPENEIEAFLASGETYFEKESMQKYLSNKISPLNAGETFV